MPVKVRARPRSRDPKYIAEIRRTFGGATPSPLPELGRGDAPVEWKSNPWSVAPR